MFKPILHNLTKNDGELFEIAQQYNKLITNKPTGITLQEKIEKQKLWELDCKNLLNEINNFKV